MDSIDRQEQLFHEDWRDALRHVVKALGGFEAAGRDLWPTKTRHAAGAWLSDCLNPERPAKLDLEDIEALHRMARDAGVHTAAGQFMAAVGYERPQVAAPKSPRTQLLEKQANLAAQQLRVQRDLDRLSQAELKAVR